MLLAGRKPVLYVSLLLAATGGAPLACCQQQAIWRGLDFPQTESILKLETLQGERLYRLPRCCWPEDPVQGAALPDRSRAPLYTGLDAISQDNFALLRYRRFALLTNSSGRDRNLKSGLELMVEAGVRPALLFEPEHGLYGHLDRSLASRHSDPRYGIPVRSLYSSVKRPSAQELDGIDLIVVDLDMLPVRCYTYVTTLSYLMESAAALGMEMMVLDRPNPYGFWRASGAFLQDGYRSFVGEAPTPFLYSLTPGEYARYLAAMKLPSLQLSVVEVAGYQRSHTDASLRRSWINPSPNIPSLEAALVYPGMALFEGLEFSLGRGTTRPFVYSGAPWLDSQRVARELRALQLPGVQIGEAAFEPQGSIFAGQTCRGLQITPDSADFDPLRTAYEYMRIIHRLHPEHFKLRRTEDGRFWMDMIWGGPGFREAALADMDFDSFRRSWAGDGALFEELTAPYRLY
ncbi:MAG: DUF1343 domain-containing protein [Leptospirales bacterium]|nr:DUF1343 domain-containing protein [Leptospirales bacterium]